MNWGARLARLRGGRAHRLARRVVPPYSLWHVALPGADRALELRWALRVRRAPVMTPEQHAAAVADPARKHTAIEVPLACHLCGGRRIQEVAHPYGRLFRDGAGRRLLDFGCGTGLFLELAHKRGFDCYGVDLAADAVAAARRRPSGGNVYQGAPADVPEIAAGGFDVITMWSVLAHLATPVEDLTMLRGLLADDGVLLALTVNAASLRFRRQLDAWGGFTPNHLIFFAPDTLRLLLGRAGFGAVVMPPWYGESFEPEGAPGVRPGVQRRLRRTINRGNRGNMLRVAAFADPDGPRRWGLEGPYAFRL
jgi:SAM-dependent methyltransferase